MTVLACSGHEHNTYVFNTDTSSRLEQQCCGSNGGFLNSIISYCGGSYGGSRGCSRGSFLQSVVSGAILALAGRAFSGIFNGNLACYSSGLSSIYGGFSGMCTGLSGAWNNFSGMCTGLAGSLGGFMGIDMNAMLAQSPLGQMAILEAENQKIQEERAEKIEKYKSVIDPALEAAGQKVNTRSQLYSELLSKCEAIKTAEPNISDEALKIRLENFARARCYDKELTTFVNQDKVDTLAVAEEGAINESYAKVGNGYVELMDANTDGKVDVKEFTEYETQVVKDKDKKGAAEEAAATMFAVIDTNGDDKLDAGELAAYNYLTATYTDAEGAEPTAAELTKDEVEKFAEASEAMVGEENLDKQVEMQRRLKAIKDEHFSNI